MKITTLVIALSLAGGCYVETVPTVDVAARPLANVAPGVDVVAGTNVYFADDAYWYWDGGLWYRSAYWGGPRISVDVVPPVLARLSHPVIYPHFGARIAVRGHWRR